MLVDRDRAATGVVEAGEELRDRGLAGARVADERDGGSRRDVEVDPVQHLGACLPVAEADVVEADVPFDPRKFAGALRGPATSGSSSITSMILSSAATADRNVL